MNLASSTAGRRAAFWIAAGAGLAMVCAAIINPSLRSVLLVSLILPVLLAFSRFRVPGLVVAFLISQSLVQLLKRAIFLLGPQPQAIYFGIQIVPTAVLAVLILVAYRHRRQAEIPGSAWFAAAFLGLGLASTLASIGELPWLAVLAAIHQQLLPFSMFFVGLLLTKPAAARIGRTMALLAAVSVIYGLIQLAFGPTIIDRAWANETYAYSIQGGKVFAFLEGASTGFRAFSYYADPLTWGLFLVACFLGAATARSFGEMSRGRWVAIIALTLAGLFCGLTRTSWVGFAVTVLVYLLLRWRAMRRPWLALALVVAAFWVVIAGGDFLYRQVFLQRRLPILENPIAVRYFTLGTAEARISALDELREGASSATLFGRGFGFTAATSRSLEATEASGPSFSHNLLVEMVANTGWLGLALFVLFYIQWLREGFGLLRIRDPGEQRAYRWLIGFSVGAVITGYLNGLSFMTYEFFLLLGFTSGQAAAMRRVQVGGSVRLPSPNAFSAVLPASAGFRTAESR